MKKNRYIPPTAELHKYPIALHLLAQLSYVEANIEEWEESDVPTFTTIRN